jgi:hypothetical protein
MKYLSKQLFLLIATLCVSAGVAWAAASCFFDGSRCPVSGGKCKCADVSSGKKCNCD